MSSFEILAKSYKDLRLPSNIRRQDSEAYAELICMVARASRLALMSCSTVELLSSVPGKSYFSFRRTVKSASQGAIVRTSRPINRGLFLTQDDLFEDLLLRFLSASYAALGSSELTKLFYTVTMSFCAANDTFKTGDKKTPATFFELLIGHIFARQFATLPRKKVSVPSIEGRTVMLPTDIVFDLGEGGVKLHVPVKLSTRERVIQAWAHQRVLEGLWGSAEFKGILVILNETKLDLERMQVTEICLPLQWAVYQRYIARMDRVYFLDVPDRYAALSLGRPKIDVKEFGSFFLERDNLLIR